jgi:hypothetical protein
VGFSFQRIGEGVMIGEMFNYHAQLKNRWRYGIILLILVIVLIFPACGGQPNGRTDETTREKESEAEIESTQRIPISLEADDIMRFYRFGRYINDRIVSVYRIPITEELDESTDLWGTVAGYMGKKAVGISFRTLLENSSYSNLINQLSLAVGDHIIAAYAKNHGIWVSFNETESFIRLLYTTEEGVFLGEEAVKEDLGRYQLYDKDLPAFRELVRNHMISKRYIDNMYEDTKPFLDIALRRMFVFENVKLELRYVSFDPEEFISSIVAEDDELRIHLGKNKGDFAVADMITVDLDEFKSVLKKDITEDDIAIYYEENDYQAPIEDVRLEIIAELAEIALDERLEPELSRIRSEAAAKPLAELEESPHVKITEGIIAIAGEDRIFTLENFRPLGKLIGGERILAASVGEVTRDFGLEGAKEQRVLFKIKYRDDMLLDHFEEIKPAVHLLFSRERGLGVAEDAAEVFAKEVIQYKDAGRFDETAFRMASESDKIRVTLEKVRFYPKDAKFDLYGEDLILKAVDAPKDSVVGPVRYGNKFYVAYIADKTEFDEDQYNETEQVNRRNILKLLDVSLNMDSDGLHFSRDYLREIRSRIEKIISGMEVILDRKMIKDMLGLEE